MNACILTEKTNIVKVKWLQHVFRHQLKYDGSVNNKCDDDEQVILSKDNTSIHVKRKLRREKKLSVGN